MLDAACLINRLTHRCLSLLLPVLSLCLGVAPRATAQAHFSGTQVNVSTAFTQPSRLALDSKGDVFVSDVATNQILEEIPDGNTYRQVVVPTSTLSGPYGVAVDPNGNVFVSDTGHNRILREAPTASGYQETVLPTRALNTPHCVFADAAGNLFICDMNNSRVLRETPVGNRYVETVVDAKIWCPSSVAEDAQGNLYVADTNSGLILKETLTGSTYTQSVVPLGGLWDPTGVAIDKAGNLYVALANANLILKETLTGSTFTLSVIASTTVNYPDALLLDSQNSLYLVDTGNHRVVKQQLQGAEFGAVPVAATPPAHPLMESLVFTADTATKLSGAPLVSRQGTTAPDFTIAGTGTCRAGVAYAAWASCTVDILFTPSLAGSVSGAVILPSSSGAAVATGYLHGTGTAGLVSFSPAAEMTIGSGLNHPQALAADAGGNLYIADTGNQRIVKETLSGGAYAQSVVSTSSLQGPLGVAVDGNGNIFVSDTGHNRLLKEAIVPPAPGASSSGAALEYVLVPNVPNAPAGVAVDGMGNLYLADAGNNRVLMGVPSGSTYTGSAMPFAGLNTVYGVAADGVGNLYLADAGNNRIVKETYAAGTYTQSVLATSALVMPKAVAVDANGDLFIADTGNGRVLEESLTGGSYVEKVVRSGLGSPDALSLDGSGNPYITDSANSVVLRESFASAPTMQFASTEAGSSSAAQLVTLANIGNAPLTFPVPASGSNPALSSGFSIDSAVTSACPAVSSGHDPGTDLAPGQSCVFSVSFTPTTLGAQQGNLIVSDSNLNADGAMQSFTLSGSATAAVPGLVLTAPSSATYGNPVQVSARVTDGQSQALIAGGSVAFTDGGAPFGTQPLLSGVATESYLPPAVGTYTLLASFTPSTNTMLRASGQAVLRVTAAPLDVLANSGSRMYGTANPVFTGSITGAVSGDSFTETFATPATAASPVASYAIVPAPAGPHLGNYSPNIQNGTLQVTPAGVTVTANNATRTYGAANPAFTGSLTGSVNGDALTATYTTTATAASPVAQYAIVPALAGAALANYTPVLQNGTLRVTAAGLSVKANDATRTYGAANPAFTGALGGIVNGDLLSESFATAATINSPVATYAIVPTATGPNIGNYTQTATNGTLTVTAAGLHVKADDATRTYGAANPAFTGAVGGAVNGDTFTESFTTPATANSALGSYAIVPTAAGPNIGNYTQTATNGTLSVTAAALSLKANDATRMYGTPNPAFTGAVSGAVNGDSFSTTYTTTATLNSPVASYPIVPAAAGPNLGNYTQTAVNGTLSVTPATLTLSAGNATRVYGAPNPPFTGAITGALPADGLAESFSTDASLNSPVGSYAITPTISGTGLGNYSQVVHKGVLIVTQAGLRVAAANATRAYGAANPVFTGSMEGALPGDQLTEQFTTTATQYSAPGTYAIVPVAQGAALANYQATVANGTLTITAGPLTYAAADATRLYGAANPAFTGSVSGAAPGDVLRESFTTAATAGSSVGVYAIIPSLSGAALGNYTPVAKNGVLTIAAAPLRVVAADAARVYGADNPTFTGAVTGAVQGDTLAASYSSTANAASPAGQYPIVAQLTGPVANYAVTSVNGVLTIEKAGSTVTLSEQSQSAGGSASVLLTAQVLAPAGAGGSVRFLNGKTELGEAALRNGVATLATSQLRLGAPNPLVAVYQGDQNVLPSSSAVLPVLLDPSGFWIKTMPGGTGLSVAAGAMAVIPLEVGPGPLGIYPGTATFTVTGLPAGATASFSPATIAADSGVQNVTLSVQMPAAAATTAVAQGLHPGLAHGLGELALALVLLPLAGARRLRKAGRSMALTLLLVISSLAGVGMLAGCGFTPGSGLGKAEAKPVTYALTITMTSGDHQQTVPASLTVTP